MNIEEIKAAAEHLSRQAAYWQRQLGEKTVSEPEIIARALLVALPVVEALKDWRAGAADTGEIDTVLAAFDKTIAEIGP